jgi:hypothetical protein
MLLSQTVLISAVLYYFGWVRTQATWTYFGIDTSLLGFTTTDYALRSINSAFLPLTGLGIAVLAAAAIHNFVVLPAVRATPFSRRRRLASIGLVAGYCLGAALLAVVAIGLLAPVSVGGPLGVLLPLFLLGAACLIAYLDQLRHTELPRRGPRTKGSGLRVLILTALAIIGLLWAVSNYAQRIGEQVALGLATSLHDRPAVILYSADRLSLAGTGVDVTTVDQEGSKYRFRYSGLVSLIHNPDRYLLIPVDWQKGQDAVFIIPTGNDLRIDLIAR